MANSIRTVYRRSPILLVGFVPYILDIYQQHCYITVICNIDKIWLGLTSSKSSLLRRTRCTYRCRKYCPKKYLGPACLINANYPHVFWILCSTLKRKEAARLYEPDPRRFGFHCFGFGVFSFVFSLSLLQASFKSLRSLSRSFGVQ